MHVPDSVLSVPVCVVAAVASLGALGWATARVVQGRERVSGERFAAVTALIFAGQMLNVPLAFESSGHLFGGVLAAVFLGVPLGMLSVSLVLLVQCLMFSDGGLAALGVNVLNMAVIGAGWGGWVCERLRAKGWRLPIAAAVAAFGSVLLAAVMASLQLAWSGAGSLALVAAAVILPHLVVGGFEAGVTAAVVWAVLGAGEKVRKDGVGRWVWIWGVPGAALVLGGLSPWASSLPDAYERGLEVLGAWSGDGPTFAGLLGDYEVPGFGPVVAVMAAAWLGTVVVWGMARLMAGGFRSGIGEV
ncbi:MAG: energy-coupling factor ABC transporter permease [Verrucomicrobiia bacterium]